jgi:hypothetical protein
MQLDVSLKKDSLSAAVVGILVIRMAGDRKLSFFIAGFPA